jgi:hypothetical protein
MHYLCVERRNIGIGNENIFLTLPNGKIITKRTAQQGWGWAQNEIRQVFKIDSFVFDNLLLQQLISSTKCALDIFAFGNLKFKIISFVNFAFDKLPFIRDRKVVPARVVENRVARWLFFKPKIQIWVTFGGSCNERCWYRLWTFGLFNSHLTYLMDYWYIVW